MLWLCVSLLEAQVGLYYQIRCRSPQNKTHPFELRMGGLVESYTPLATKQQISHDANCRGDLGLASPRETHPFV